MNISKFIATLVVKNHNGGSFELKDTCVRDAMYKRISSAIELSKNYCLRVVNKDDRFIIEDLLDDSNFKPISIYKRTACYQELADFFYGLQRTKNVHAYLSYFRHVHEEALIQIVQYNGSSSISIVDSSQKTIADNVICCAI